MSHSATTPSPAVEYLASLNRAKDTVNVTEAIAKFFTQVAAFCKDANGPLTLSRFIEELLGITLQSQNKHALEGLMNYLSIPNVSGDKMFNPTFTRCVKMMTGTSHLSEDPDTNMKLNHLAECCRNWEFYPLLTREETNHFMPRVPSRSQHAPSPYPAGVPGYGFTGNPYAMDSLPMVPVRRHGWEDRPERTTAVARFDRDREERNYAVTTLFEQVRGLQDATMKLNGRADAMEKGMAADKEAQAAKEQAEAERKAARTEAKKKERAAEIEAQAAREQAQEATRKKDLEALAARSDKGFAKLMQMMERSNKRKASTSPEPESDDPEFNMAPPANPAGAKPNKAYPTETEAERDARLAKRRAATKKAKEAGL